VHITAARDQNAEKPLRTGTLPTQVKKIERKQKKMKATTQTAPGKTKTGKAAVCHTIKENNNHGNFKFFLPQLPSQHFSKLKKRFKISQTSFKKLLPVYV